MTAVPAAAHAVATVVAETRGAWVSEAQLHTLLEATLRDAGFGVQREIRLTSADRIDLLVTDPDGTPVGVEVKVTGSLIAVVRQLQRYAHSPDIDALVLATTRVQHEAAPDTLAGMPVLVARIRGGVFG
jgi:RecB family endonuclease NucS